MKKAIVIGATSGIGRELALLLARNGYKVGITGRREELLREVAAGRSDNFVVSAFDAVSDGAVPALESLIAGLGGMDLFVFCSGMGDMNPALDLTIEEATNELNVRAFVRLAGFAYNYFAAQGSGHIACITSVMGLRGSGIAPSYAASKAYQINYLEGLRQRSFKAGAGIVVTDLRPGSVRTDMMKGEGHFWIASPEKAAATIYKAIRKERAVQYVTPRWRIMGWLLKNLPRGIHKRM